MSGIEPLPGEQGGEAAAEIFYSRAVERIMRSIMVLGVCAFPVVWVCYGIVPAAGFLLGAAISYLNFHWLNRAVSGLADRIVETHSPEQGTGIVVRFLVRYLLIGLAAYVTFIGWSAAFYGLLVGLCLPVAGMMGEAAFETYAALRRGL